MIEETVQNLNKKGFIAKCIRKQDLKASLMEILKKDDVIGCGGSMTLEELGILTQLKQEGYPVLSLETCDIDWEELCAQSRNVDFYLSSSNAISSDGCLVNIDGRGNRVANLIYGPKNVVIIAGSNKITKTLEQAVHRAKNVAAPQNCKRLKKNTPCVKTGRCMDCSSPDRICRSTVIHTNPNSRTKTYVFLMDETLGY